MRRSAPWRMRSGLLAFAWVLGAAAAVRAQDPPLLDLEVRDSDAGVTLELGEIFEGGGIRESLEAGLPVRVEIVTELWRDRFFDSLEGREEWRATLWYDPIADAYRLETADTPIARTPSVDEALNVLRSMIQVDLEPGAPGSYYYLGRLEVATLSLSDLEELRRWLQGELGPAIDGNEEVGGAVGRGLRRLFVRALGLPALRAQARSARFEWDG